jgi:hypothetical protein
MGNRRRALGAMFVFGSALFCPAAAAQTPPPAAATLSPDQLTVFADVVGEPESTVAGRLQLDPKLGSLAVAAVDARASRKSTGKVMAIVGFAILGVGDIAGAVVIATAPGYPAVRDDGWKQVGIGLGVALVSLGVGLGLGIPGLVKMARYSDEENAALQYYEQTGSGGRPTPGPPISSGKALTAPIISFSF